MNLKSTADQTAHKKEEGNCPPLLLDPARLAACHLISELAKAALTIDHAAVVPVAVPCAHRALLRQAVGMAVMPVETMAPKATNGPPAGLATHDTATGQKLALNGAWHGARVLVVLPPAIFVAVAIGRAAPVIVIAILMRLLAAVALLLVRVGNTRPYDSEGGNTRDPFRGVLVIGARRRGGQAGQRDREGGNDRDKSRMYLREHGGPFRGSVPVDVLRPFADRAVGVDKSDWAEPARTGNNPPVLSDNARVSGLLLLNSRAASRILLA